MFGRGSLSLPNSTLRTALNVSASSPVNSRMLFSSSNIDSLPLSPRSANTACAVRRHIDANALNAPAEKHDSASRNSSSGSSGRYVKYWKCSGARSSSVKSEASSTRLFEYSFTGNFRNTGALHESQRNTRPTWLGR